MGKTKGQKPSEYKGDYNPPFAGGVEFGYEGELGNNSYRAELEAMHSSVKADNVGLEGNQMSLSYLKDIGTGSDKRTYVYAAEVDNDQIDNTSVMANAYYHLKNDSFSLFALCWSWDRFNKDEDIWRGINKTHISIKSWS